MKISSSVGEGNLTQRKRGKYSRHTSNKHTKKGAKPSPLLAKEDTM
jgi:hypothetical protein